MSNVSEYVIDLELQDKSRDAIRDVENKLKDIGKIAKNLTIGKTMAKSLNETEIATDEIIAKLKEMTNDTSLDLDALVKSYEHNSKKALGELESQYIRLKAKQDNVIAEQARLATELKNQEIIYNDIVKHGGEAVETALYMRQIEKQISELENDKLDTQIEQNRNIRAKLTASIQQAKIDAAVSKQTEKLKILQDKRDAASSKKEKKALEEQIKQQKYLIKVIEQGKKAYEANEKAIKNNVKAIQEVTVKASALQKIIKAGEIVNGLQQRIYNTAGLIGGVARTGKAVAKAGFGIAQGIGSAISAVSSGADQEVERERQANRVKGMSNDDAKSLLRELNVYTGADYSTIVDAINRVQGTLGRGLQRGELTQAVEMELRYPGISTAFASATGTGEAGAVGFRHYASKLNAIQKATGASAEQIAASTQAFANRKDIRKSSAAVSDYQAVYLAMQNSGAFESEEELNSVFDKFVQKHISSGKDVFEFAETFKMADYVHDTRNKIQAKTADSNMNWRQFAKDVRGSDGNEYGPSDAEKMAIKMREIEDKKNQLLMKLVPAVLPVVEKIADLITSPAGDQIIDGFVNLFKTVIPMLEPIFRALGVFLEFMSQTILPMFQWLVEKVSEFLGEQIDKAVDLLPQNANGGIATGPSIVGERAFQPEMILPLDYSRASRAGNIIQSVSQTFNMSGNETTALSLSQAVKSREFRRATAQNAFITARGGRL